MFGYSSKEKEEVLEQPLELEQSRGSAARGELERYDAAEYGSTRRGLKSRHIQLIAIGGAIGTGLFVGSGATLSLVGPAPFFMAFVVMSMIIWVVMNSLAEMTTWLPVSGTSVPFYVNRFLDPSMAFAAGWNYWYAYAILVAAEISAASIVIDYWTTKVPVAVWLAILLVLVLCLNVFVVSLYGEVEFWFASIKIIAIVGLIILGIVIFFGGAPTHHRLGFHYWMDPGAFVPYQSGGSTGRFLAFWTALVRSGFAFILSPELITTAAGESEAPRRNIPKASSRFVYRLAVFYCLGSLVISVIVPYNNPNLLSGTGNASASPFVLGIQLAGIPVLNNIINAVILTSATSAANSFLFAASRNLYSLALTGQAPKVFRKCSKNGVPYVAVLFSAALACLVFLSVSESSATAFGWFLNITTISGFIAWIVVLLTYTRFHKALKLASALDQRPYKTIWQPYATWVVLVILILLTLTNGFQVFCNGNFTASGFLAAYITLPLFLALYIGHKIFYRTPLARRVEDIDLWSGKAEQDRLEELFVEPVPRNFGERIWYWIA